MSRRRASVVVTEESLARMGLINLGLVEVCDTLLAVEDSRQEGGQAYSPRDSNDATCAAMGAFSFQTHVQLGLMNLNQQHQERCMAHAAAETRESVVTATRARNLVRGMSLDAGGWCQVPAGVVPVLKPPPSEDGPDEASARMKKDKQLPRYLMQKQMPPPPPPPATWKRSPGSVARAKKVDVEVAAAAAAVEVAPAAQAAGSVV